MVRFFEILINPTSQVTNVGAEGIYINNGNPEWRELQAYAEIYRSGRYKTGDYVGVFSPKFGLKVGITVEEFNRFVEAAPVGCDVSFVNPFPQIGYRSLNVWMQGELAHPGLIALAKDLVAEAKVDCPILPDNRQGPDKLCYCNFWAGAPRFWEEYVGGVLMPIVELLEATHDSSLVSKLMSETTHTVPAPFIPFIIERLFSSFLQARPGMVTRAWRHSISDVIDKYCLNDFERILVRGMKEEVDRLDAEGGDSFSPDICRRMWLNSMLSQQHHDDYYQFVSHPHSGHPIKSSILGADNY
jgi:hypothetical protein